MDFIFLLFFSYFVSRASIISFKLHLLSLRLLLMLLYTQIGHNIGYAHSNEGGTTYSDQTGMMGYSYNGDDSPLMCFNAAKSWQSKWYTTKSTVVDPSAGNCFEGNVYGIADYGTIAASTVLVKIDDASATDFFVNFNRRTGINSGTQEAGNLVTVVQAGGEGNSYAESSLMAKLGAGGSWSGVVDGKTMVVNVLSINTSANPAYATVRISENGTACGTVSPTMIPTTAVPSLLPTTSAQTSANPTTSMPSTTPSTVSPTSQSIPQPTPAPTMATPSTPPTVAPPSTPRPTQLPTPVCLLTGAPIICTNTINSKCCSGQCVKQGSKKNTCK